jgi:hypothetical protein
VWPIPFNDPTYLWIDGMPYVLVPRELSREEWEKKYCSAPIKDQ